MDTDRELAICFGAPKISRNTTTDGKARRLDTGMWNVFLLTMDRRPELVEETTRHRLNIPRVS